MTDNKQNEKQSGKIKGDKIVEEKSLKNDTREAVREEEASRVEEKSGRNDTKESQVVAKSKKKLPALADSIAVEYLLACISLVFAIVGFGVGALGYSSAFFSGNSFLISLVVIFASFGLINAIVARTLFSRVSNSIQARPGFVGRKAYKYTTYGTYAVLLLIAIFVISLMASNLISSLVFLKGLYLGQFLMGGAVLLITAFASMYFRSIVVGQNKSAALSNMVLVATSILAGLVIISGLFLSISNIVKTMDNGYGRGSSRIENYRAR